MSDPTPPPPDGDDDWVKQALAAAMLGGDLPEPDPSPVPEPDTPEPVAESALEPESVTAGSAPSGRMFERPAFDATKDPDVDSMLRAEAERPIDVSEPDEGDRSRFRNTVEWLIVLGSAVVVALVLRAFLFQAFYIPSASMEETLLINDRVLVNKLSYRLHDIHRGDVVVFSRPENDPGEFQDLIKRVIGLPGETIEARGNTIFIDGHALIEPYLSSGEVIADFDPVTIPEGEIFVMGDNRDNSGDSRLFGTIEEDRVTGRAFFLFWPFSRAGSL